MAHEDFNDDKKDAGELGAGHSVTALYEVIPANATAKPALPTVDRLRYQDVKASQAAAGGELFTVKLRYKDPKSSSSQLPSHAQMDIPITLDAASTDLRFASAVAEFGLLLRGSAERAQSSYEAVLGRAHSAKGADSQGYRADFIGLVRRTRLLAGARKEIGAAVETALDGILGCSDYVILGCG